MRARVSKKIKMQKFDNLLFKKNISITRFLFNISLFLEKFFKSVIRASPAAVS